MTILITPIADAFVESGRTLQPSLAAQANLSAVCIGRRLRVKRTSHGISQQEFSERLGIDCDDLNAYEAGAERIRANLLLRIVELLDVRPDYFFRGYTKEELEGCLVSDQLLPSPVD